MTEKYRISELNMAYDIDRELLKAFLEKQHLKFEEDVDVAFGILDQEDNIHGCGCGSGPLLKCFAVDDELKGQNALGPLVSALISNRFEAELYNLYIITRPKNEVLFKSCGFHRVSGTESLVMMENFKNGPEDYAKAVLREFKESKIQVPDHLDKSGTDKGQNLPENKTIHTKPSTGAIVMNCNPLTLGHRHLIEYAALDCDLLYIFVVQEDKSLFPAIDRLELVREGTKDLSNVRVVFSGRYMISSTTFPTYFLKEDEDAGKLYSRLDASIFADRIAPALNITKRYAGQEPLDPITEKYNNALSEILPKKGIEFKIIPRLEGPDGIISASRARELYINKGVCPELAQLVPKCTLDYLKVNTPAYK